MTPARVRWLALVAALLVLLAGYLSLTRSVTILADGQAIKVATRAITVRGALDAAGLHLGSQDEVEPSPFSLLRNDLVIALRRAAYVQLHADGRSYGKLTAERELSTLLAEWDSSLGESDRVLLAGRPVSLEEELPYSPLLILQVRRAVEVKLDEDGEQKTISSSASTLGEALAEAGVQLYAADRLQPAPETRLDGPITATLVRAEPIEIVIAGRTLQLRTAAATVGEALAEAGIALQGLDYSKPADDQPIPEDRSIRVVRVSETLLLDLENTPHETEWQPDPEAELDSTSVIQLGQDGVRAARVRVRYEDGKEVSRQAEGQRVLVEPQTQINGYGTKIVLHTAVVDGVTIEYYRAVEVFVTSYSPCRSGVSGCLNGTSSGLPVQKGTIATYLSWYRALKFATIYVPGYGPGTIGDVGAYPSGDPWIDLAYSDADYVGWAQWVTIYFTTPVPAYVPLIWPP